MAHQPKPFFRTGRGWFVQLATKQIKLCDGPKNGETEKLAWAEFHKFMVDRTANDNTPAPKNSANSATLSVAEVFEKFLDWCKQHRSPRTYELAKKHIQSFCDHLKTATTLPVTGLRPFHVVEWADSKKTWGPNEKRNRVGNVTRALNWAEKLGHIDASPVRGVEKPGRTKRESKMTPADFATLLSHIAEGDPFRDLVLFSFEAGCRPQESRLIEARHLKPEHRRVEIPPKEAKGKKRWRVIYLSDAAFTIVARLAEEHPTGPLFLNTDGNAWKAQAVVCRFQRLLVKMSGAEDELPKLPRFDHREYPNPVERAAAKAEHEKELAEVRRQRAKLARQGEARYSMYDLRHLFATRKLKEGHDPITVATLLGHKDTGMLARHYQELTKDFDHLLNAANGPREQ
jgi:integrase